MKKIVTHINPDLDAVASVWLIRRFLPGWEEARVGFIPASLSTKEEPKENDPNTLYVDVGRGMLDHHQTGEYLSAAKLCWEYILKIRKNQPLSKLEQEAVGRLVEVVTQVDNARDLNWEEVKKDRYRFYLHNLIEDLRGLGLSDQEVTKLGLIMFDGVLLGLKHQVRAEEELKKGIEFQTPWGKGIACLSGNKRIIWESEVLGYALGVRKDPKTGGVQIYSRWDSGADLTEAYNRFRKMDPQSDWFLHASKKLLLNQASVNPKMRPTKLRLEEIIEVLKK